MTGRAGRVRLNPTSFEQLAAHYARLAELGGTETRGWLFLRLPARAGRVVDLGCGTGPYTTLLAERFSEVLAVDVSGAMLARARARRPPGNVRYEQRDLLDVTRERDGAFDAVLSTSVLHHLPVLETALEHLGSLVRPGGQLLVTDYVEESGKVSRAALRADAWRTFRADLMHRRRPPVEAVELLRLQLSRGWLAHRRTDRVQTPAEWERLAADAFPGASICQLHRARALHWRAPAWI